jgi:hypothetical protein
LIKAALEGLLPSRPATWPVASLERSEAGKRAGRTIPQQLQRIG